MLILKMRKRIFFLSALLSLIPFGQTFIIKTGLGFATAGLIISVAESTHAGLKNDYYFNRAYDNAEKGMHLEAIADYTKAIKIDPKDADAFYNRGISKNSIKDYYGAIEDYTKLIQINPKYSDAYFNRANTKDDIKDYYGAVADYTKVIEINPKDAEAFANRGITKESIGDMDGACSDWAKAARLGDTNSVEWVRLDC